MRVESESTSRTAEYVGIVPNPQFFLNIGFNC